MHREIQIKQFPIVTTHWWPKTRNERFVWENEQYLYRFLPLVHNHVIWVRTRIRCVTCVCARSGSRLTEGVSEAWCWRNFVVFSRWKNAHCHRSCRFWTVYSRIMMTSLKQTLLYYSFFFSSPVSCLNKLFLDLLFFTWLGGSDAGWGGWSCGMCVWLVTDEWNGYMERSYRNTMHDSKRVCLREVIIILE